MSGPTFKCERAVPGRVMQVGLTQSERLGIDASPVVCGTKVTYPKGDAMLGVAMYLPGAPYAYVFDFAAAEGLAKALHDSIAEARAEHTS